MIAIREMGPRNDQVLIKPFPATPRGGRVFGELGRIIVPDVGEEPSRTGEVLAVGPGRWMPGEWWNVHKYPDGACACEYDGLPERHWEWFQGYRETPELKVGDFVLFGRYAGAEFRSGEDSPDFVGLRLMKESEIILKIERNGNGKN